MRNEWFLAAWAWFNFSSRHQSAITAFVMRAHHSHWLVVWLRRKTIPFSQFIGGESRCLLYVDLEIGELRLGFSSGLSLTP